MFNVSEISLKYVISQIKFHGQCRNYRKSKAIVAEFPYIWRDAPKQFFKQTFSHENFWTSLYLIFWRVFLLTHSTYLSYYPHYRPTIRWPSNSATSERKRYDKGMFLFSPFFRATGWSLKGKSEKKKNLKNTPTITSNFPQFRQTSVKISARDNRF